MKPGHLVLSVMALASLLLAACQPTRTPTPVVYEIPTEVPALLPDYSVANYTGSRQIYYPFPECAPSRLYVGDRVYVSFGGTPNSIRSYPDVHPADNKIGLAMQGEGMAIIGGPACSYGWILWEVITDGGLQGWTAETNGREFWLLAMDEPPNVPDEVVGNPQAYAVYEEATSIMRNPSLSYEERSDRVRILQDTYGAELLSLVIRYVPSYDPHTDSIVSFDSYMRGLASDFGPSMVGSPIEQDPIGASISLFFDTSPENITQQLGLDQWFP